MTILLVLIPLGLVLLGVAAAAFIWAVGHGQFEDLEGEGSRILFDEKAEEVQAERAETRGEGAR